LATSWGFCALSSTNDCGNPVAAFDVDSSNDTSGDLGSPLGSGTFQARELVDVEQYNVLFVQRFELKAVRKRLEVLNYCFVVSKMRKVVEFPLSLWDQCGIFAIIDWHKDHQFELVVVISVVGINEARVIEVF
jgi:hypothetical protein